MCHVSYHVHHKSFIYKSHIVIAVRRFVNFQKCAKKEQALNLLQRFKHTPYHLRRSDIPYTLQQGI